MKLELGGGRIVEEGWTIVDCGDYGQEYVLDVDEDGLKPFADESIEALRSHYFLEHIANTVFVMNECWRVLKPGGRFSIKIPRFPHENSVSDPIHKSWWVPDTFLKYYAGVRPINADYGIKPWCIVKFQAFEVQMYVTLEKPWPIPVVIAYSNKRPRLLEQTLQTLEDRTRYPYTPYSQHDESGMPTQVGVRNEMLQRAGDWEFAVSLDDDVFLNDGWLCTMVEAARCNPDVWVVAGTTYPRHHRPIESRKYVTTVETAPGVCLFIRRKAWDRCGPFDVGLPSGKIWDHEFSRRVQAAGGKVAFLNDQTRIIHCGITSVKGRGRSAEVEAWMRELADKVGAIAK